MNRILIVLAVMTLIWSGPVQASPRNAQQVESAVETWLQKGLTDNRPNAQVASLDPHYVAGEVVAYIAHLAGGGFCLCGADDILVPVYLYVPEGHYDPESPSLKAILAEMASRMAFVRQEQSTGGAALDPYRQDLILRKQEWNELEAGQALSRVADEKNRDIPTQMILPLNSSWTQGAPYNADCPTMPGEQPSIVGCVATAMAQVMYYWQWPETGSSSHTAVFTYRTSDTWISTALATNPGISDSLWDDRLRWTSMDGGFLQMRGNWDISWKNRALDSFNGTGVDEAITSLFNQLNEVSQNHFANFAATSYNFDLMSDTHPDGSGGGDQAVAQLCYHAGISVDMSWGRYDSGAFTSATGDAYENHFRYDPDHVWGDLDTDLIIDETQWLRPVHVRGANNVGGGHSWIVCGYDLFTPYNPYFWMNMGWGSADIGWFRFDNVPGGFEVGNEHTTYIAPASVVRFVGPEGTSGADGSPANPYLNISDAVNETPDDGTIIIKAGTDANWSGGGVMARPVTLKGKGVTISFQ